MSERGETLRGLRERLERKLAEGIADAPSKRPRLVCRDGVVVGDADVIVSERDPNYRVRAGIGFDGRIKVRR